MRTAENPAEGQTDPGPGSRSTGRAVPATPDAPPPPVRTVRFEPRNVWQAGLVLLALIVVALLGRFVLTEGKGVLVTILMAWFASIAMEPAVRPLSRHMPRAAATGLVMLSVVVAAAIFLTAFGNLFVSQVTQLVKALPGLLDDALELVNERLGADFDVQTAIEQLGINPGQIAGYGADLVGGILGVLITVVGGFFSLFTFALFAFYLSSDGPRFRLYLATLFPQRLQPLAVQVWDITAQKTGRYVAARVVLATINGTATAIVFALIGMPSWFALAVWTGLVAQFVPTIGTYISIALPVLVGLVSPEPWVGLAALAWGLVYQQVENLTIEPRISAKAVNVHPAAAFGFVLLGAALFGIAGALLAIPVGAMLIALMEARNTRFELRADLADGREILDDSADEPSDDGEGSRSAGRSTGHPDEASMPS
ncbi:MAG: AI-2E family transporter [Cellulomonadaceae bacterium]|nr:AI-2E family transporter [Cellulomonadaceae bacterium]